MRTVGVWTGIHKAVAVRADDLPSRHGFANGLERDLDAVTVGLTLRWSSGPVEGHVNRVIMWNLFRTRADRSRSVGCRIREQDDLADNGIEAEDRVFLASAFRGHQHRLAEFAPDRPQEVAEHVDPLLTLQFTKVDVEVDLGLRYEPEDRKHEQQQVVTLWTTGSTPAAGGPLIEPAGSTGGLVLSGALTMLLLPIAALAVLRKGQAGSELSASRCCTGWCTAALRSSQGDSGWESGSRAARGCCRCAL